MAVRIKVGKFTGDDPCLAKSGWCPATMGAPIAGTGVRSLSVTVCRSAQTRKADQSGAPNKLTFISLVVAVRILSGLRPSAKRARA
jgi:hypothetical protein